MSIEETLKKWDLIMSQVPYRRDGAKESMNIVHLPIAHPDRNDKNKNLTCPGLTWADLHEVFEALRKTL